MCRDDILNALFSDLASKDLGNFEGDQKKDRARQCEKLEDMSVAPGPSR